VTSDWYRKLFPNFKIAKDQNRKTKFSTTKHGFRLATSVGGTTIGEGGDVLIVDDPLSPLQANSKKYRERAIAWYKESFSTRLNDKKSGIKVIVMQRLHTDDLVGRLVKKSCDWKIIAIPAIATKNQVYDTENFSYHRKQGEYLHNEREGEIELAQIKRQIGSYAFSAQYQQMPISEEGTLIKKHWLKRYDRLPETPLMIGQSWDLAFTNKSYSDYSVCTTWHIHQNGYFLAHVYRVQKQFPELVDDCHKLYQRFSAEFIIIEDTVSSKAFIQEVKRRGICRVIARRPVQDKYTRLAILTPIFEAGEVYLPDNSDWLTEFEDEVLNFPRTPHDDQVDSITQFLSYAKKLNGKSDGKFITTIA
jgi:predicted phage terminase large subunit-like protein